MFLTRGSHAELAFFESILGDSALHKGSVKRIAGSYGGSQLTFLVFETRKKKGGYKNTAESQEGVCLPFASMSRIRTKDDNAARRGDINYDYMGLPVD